MYLGDKNKLFTIICVLFGLVTVLPMIEVVKYLSIIITVLVLVSLVERKNNAITTLYISIIAGLVTASISLASNLFSNRIGEAIILSIAEGIAVISFAIVFRKGIDGILRKSISQSLDNEEVISLSILMAIWIYGLPKINDTSIVIHAFACLFLLLFIGYKYGWIRGNNWCNMGVAMSLLSGSYSMISFYCILGILAGTFRELGRLTVAIMFLVGASAIFVLSYGTFADARTIQGGVIPVGASTYGLVSGSGFKEALVPLISGSLLFLLLPESIAYRV